MFESWKKEKAVLISQITELKAEYELKFDEVEQYSRRSCLIMTCVKEGQEESTDKIVLDIFLNNLGVRFDLSEIDRSHRLGPKKTDLDRNVSNRPIIIKFISYRSRQKVYKVKKKLKDSSYSIFDNLTKRRSSLQSVSWILAEFNFNRGLQRLYTGTCIILQKTINGFLCLLIVFLKSKTYQLNLKDVIKLNRNLR